MTLNIFMNLTLEQNKGAGAFTLRRTKSIRKPGKPSKKERELEAAVRMYQNELEQKVS